jgi:16S rRNA (adenine1518-N6/adenine1519-N6)-dimethyltransferase
VSAGRAGAPHPRKRFGQHFLHDPAVVARIVAAVAPKPEDHLLEIGPGTGILTEALLAAVPRLDAVEIDRDLARLLEQRFAGRGLRLRCMDALALALTDLGAPSGALRVVGNLPYNVSTPLLFHLIRERAAIRDMHFMLQREVVERLAARPGGRDYGRLGVMVQVHCRVEPLFRVGPGAFQPPPRVESAVARLVPRERPAVPEAHLPALERIVRVAFGRRRKTLRNALRGVLDEDAIIAAGVDPSARPETVTVAAFAALAAGASPSAG